jgi:formate dehydrogenase assembly factor FdhD
MVIKLVQLGVPIIVSRSRWRVKQTSDQLAQRLGLAPFRRAVSCHSTAETGLARIDSQTELAVAPTA